MSLPLSQISPLGWHSWVLLNGLSLLRSLCYEKYVFLEFRFKKKYLCSSVERHLGDFANFKDTERFWPGGLGVGLAWHLSLNSLLSQVVCQNGNSVWELSAPKIRDTAPLGQVSLSQGTGKFARYVELNSHTAQWSHREVLSWFKISLVLEYTYRVGHPMPWVSMVVLDCRREKLRHVKELDWN